MSNPTRKYKIKYEIEINGYSRGKENEETLQEELITNLIEKAVVYSLRKINPTKFRITKYNGDGSVSKYLAQEHIK